MFSIKNISHWGYASHPKCAASNRQSESSGIWLLARVSDASEDSLPTEAVSESVACNEERVSRSVRVTPEAAAAPDGKGCLSSENEEAILEIFGKVRVT